MRYVGADRFLNARLGCLLSRPAAAQLLRVSERTIRNWETGRTAIPYAAYKLMRILRGYELPGDAWDGWYLIDDKLWSPEGRCFKASEHGWWSLLVAQAREFRAHQAAQRTARQQADVQPAAISGSLQPLAGMGQHGVGSDACTPTPAPSSSNPTAEGKCLVPTTNRGLKWGSKAQSGVNLAPLHDSEQLQAVAS